MKDDSKIELVTEIGVFGTLNIPDPTTVAVSESAKELEEEKKKKKIAEESMDMDALADKILNS